MLQFKFTNPMLGIYAAHRMFMLPKTMCEQEGITGRIPVCTSPGRMSKPITDGCLGYPVAPHCVFGRYCNREP